MERNNVRAQGILGREVIALKDGSFIGKIQSVAIDSANKKVTGLYVKLKGILSGKNFIPFNSIQAFGSHTVTIKEDYEGETGSKNVAEEKDIIDVPVITINGTMLGKVDDFMFDRSDGAITEYILTEGLVQDTLRGKAALNGAKISRIGKDVIVALGEVDETGLEELDPLYEELGADVVENFAEGKEALEDTMEDFNEEIDEKKEEAEKAWQQAVKKAKEVTDEWTKKVKEQAEKVGDEAKELWSDAQSKAQKQLEKINKVKEKWQEKITDVRNVKEVELGDQILNEIKGKTINKPLYDEAGIIIIKPGQTIDDEVIKKALEIGKLHDLLKLAAAKDVEDEIIEIKKIEE